jgi:hypothetical protein
MRSRERPASELVSTPINAPRRVPMAASTGGVEELTVTSAHAGTTEVKSAAQSAAKKRRAVIMLPFPGSFAPLRLLES